MNKLIQLLQLLSGNRKYSMNELVDRFEVSERSIYRYLNAIEESGFVLDRADGLYKLVQDHSSTLSIKRLLHFTEDEAYVLYHALESMQETTVSSKNLIKKLHTLYNLQVLQKIKRDHELTKIKQISQAVKNKNCVVLHQYHSSNSNKIEDREVEPFEIMSDYKAIWCFDLRGRKVKQFKMFRLREVEILPKHWQNEAKHILPFTDAFRMSSSKPLTNVKAKLTLKAYNLLSEEFPLTKDHIKIENGEYLLDIPVADFQGIGRFILGLPDEVKLESPVELKEYLNKKRKINF